MAGFGSRRGDCTYCSTYIDSRGNHEWSNADADSWAAFALRDAAVDLEHISDWNAMAERMGNFCFFIHF